MNPEVKPIPEGYQSVTAYLIVKEAAKAIEFYQTVFGAKEKLRLNGPDERVMHCELTIGDSMVMLADECTEMGFKSPESYGGSPISMMIYLDHVDEVFAAAIEQGCVQLRPVVDQFYGDRMGTLQDPFGHVWSLATHVEDVSEEEMARRFNEMMKSGGNG